MRTIRYIVLAMLALAACSKKRIPVAPVRKASEEKIVKYTEKPATTDFASKGYSKAMVLNFKGRDGCDFALELETGEKLEPNFIPDVFQKDSIKVWIKYNTRLNTASICMIGKMIILKDIQKQ